MKLISFSMTKEAFLDGSKTVTRRLGWKTLKVGDRLMAVEKAMGLRKGEKIFELGAIEVVKVSREPLNWILNEPDGAKREGFPHLSASDFIDHFAKAMKIGGADEITRIEFRRVDGAKRNAKPANECEDCGDETKRRIRCPRCQKLVCSWCRGHVHIDGHPKDASALKASRSPVSP